MNFKEEFIKFKEIGYEQLNKEFISLREELEEKEYLFEVINTLNILEDYINSLINKGYDEEIKYIRFKKEYDYDYGNNLTNFTFIDKNQNDMKDSEYFLYDKELNVIKSLFGNNLILEPNLSNNKLEKIGNNYITIPFNQEFTNTLRGYLLNDKLIAIYEYNQLDDDIELSNNINKKNKSKI